MVSVAARMASARHVRLMEPIPATANSGATDLTAPSEIETSPTLSLSQWRWLSSMLPESITSRNYSYMTMSQTSGLESPCLTTAPASGLVVHESQLRQSGMLHHETRGAFLGWRGRVLLLLPLLKVTPHTSKDGSTKTWMHVRYYYLPPFGIA